MNLLAQNFDAIQAAGLPGFSVPDKVGPIITLVLPYIFYGSGIGLLVYFVMGGFQLMTSVGDPKKMQGGKMKITNAVVGFIIIVFSGIIVSVIGRVFGIPVFDAIF